MRSLSFASDRRFWRDAERTLPVSLAILFAVAAGHRGSATAAEASPPNILFLLVDDQRNDTLGCAGHEIVQTPNIDQIAKRGTRFRNAFVTTPICWVSRASVLTGMWSRSHGSQDRIDRVSPEAAERLYPTLLENYGYRNGFFGKWDARMPTDYKRQSSFDTFEDIGRNPYFKAQPDGSLLHETDRIADRATEFLRNHPPDKPFCLNLWFNAAHAEDGDHRPGVGHYPWPPSTDGMYEDVDIPSPRLGAKEIYESQPDFLKKSLNRERFFWRWDTPEKYTTNMRAYFRMLSGIDNAIGRVIEVLRQRGLAENTVIIYAADNGYYMGNRGFAGKWSHYEESLRVPLIMYDPRRPSGATIATSDRLVLNVDIPATILDLAGVPVPESYQGSSLQPLLSRDTESAVPWRREFFAEHLVEMGARIPKWEGIRGERYVYAHYFENDYEFLHDLHADPDQLKNFASDPEYQQALEQMRELSGNRRDAYTEARHRLTQSPPANLLTHPVEQVGSPVPLDEDSGKVQAQ